MGRIRRLLNQDASTAADRIAVPYARFVTSHTLVTWIVYAAVIAVIWVLVSRTLALIVLGTWLILLVYGLAIALWKRRVADH